MTRYWEPGVAYSTGEVLEYQGQRYKVIQGHSSQVCSPLAQGLRSDGYRDCPSPPLQSDWAPGTSTAALFQPIGSDNHSEPPPQCHEPRHVHEHPQGVTRPS